MDSAVTATIDERTAWADVGVRIARPALPAPPRDIAAEQVACAFPHTKPLSSYRLFYVINECGSPMLRKAVDDDVIRPKVAFELCHLDHAGQDAIVALGARCATHAAHQLARIRRIHERQSPYQAQGGAPCA